MFGMFHRLDNARFQFVFSEPPQSTSIDFQQFLASLSLRGLFAGSDPITADESLGYFGAIGEGPSSSSAKPRVRSVQEETAEDETGSGNKVELQTEQVAPTEIIAQPKLAPKVVVPRLFTVLRVKQVVPPPAKSPGPRQSYAAMAISGVCEQPPTPPSRGSDWPVVAESSAMGALRESQMQRTSHPVTPASSEKIDLKPENSSTELDCSSHIANTTTTLETNAHIVSSTLR